MTSFVVSSVFIEHLCKRDYLLKSKSLSGMEDYVTMVDIVTDNICFSL